MIKTLWMYGNGLFCLPYFTPFKIITFFCAAKMAFALILCWHKTPIQNTLRIILNLIDKHGFVIIHLCAWIFGEMHMVTSNQIKITYIHIAKIDNHSMEWIPNTNRQNGIKTFFSGFPTTVFPNTHKHTHKHNHT